MSLLTLNPPPGLYPEARTVTVTAANPNLRVLWSDTAADPLFVRTVASSPKTGEERPYVQVIDDGLGAVVMDGAFSKYYNGRVGTSTEEPTRRYFVNAMKYLNRKGRTNGSKKALLINDASLTDNGGAGAYSVRSTFSSGFGTFLPSLFSGAGYTLTIKDRDDYVEGEITPTLSELNAYDVIFVMGSRVNVGLNPAVAKLFAAVRKNGIGLYLCTDHGTDDVSGYYIGVNNILNEITDAKFIGSYDFSPGTTVGYNKALYGDHPLFEGMDDTEVISGSTSDSNVVQAIPSPLILPQTVTVDKAYTTLKFAVQDTSTGELTSETYNYYVNAEPLYTILHANGTTPIEEWAPSTVTTRYVRFRRTKQYFDAAEGDQLVSGLIQIGGRVIGSFTETLVNTTDDQGNPRQYAGQQFQFLENPFTEAGSISGGFFVKMPYWLSENITLVVNSPFSAQQAWKFNRIVPGKTNWSKFSVAMAEIIKVMPGLATEKTLAGRVKKLRDAGFITGPALSWPDLAQELYDKLLSTTDSFPTLTTAP